MSNHVKTLPRIPHQEKAVDHQKCRSIYWNLLTVRTRDLALTDAAWIREFYQTERCDEFADFKSARNDLASFLGHTVAAKILDGKEEEFEQHKATDAVLHYASQNQNMLLAALPFRDCLYDHTIERAEAAVSKIFSFLKRPKG